MKTINEFGANGPKKLSARPSCSTLYEEKSKKDSAVHSPQTAQLGDAETRHSMTSELSRPFSNRVIMPVQAIVSPKKRPQSYKQVAQNSRQTNN